MLTYHLENRCGLSRYDYLYRCVKEDILSGRLRPGEKLPSKRGLARHLQLSVVTVENAYAQLAAEGYIRPEEKRGYFVEDVEARPAPAQSSGAGQEERGEDGLPWLLDLRAGGGGAEGFPFSVWARLMRRVLSQRGEELLRAVPHNGVPELRRAISRHLYQFRGITAGPEQIVVGAGTEYLYNLIVQLLGREPVYGLEDPGYPKAARIYRLAGVSCVFLPMDGAGVRPEDGERAGVRVLHLSPNHQFPTGAVTPVPRRQALLRWAAQGEGRYIIEDDYDSEFRFTGRPIPAMQSIGRGERVIYVNTFSRTLVPSLRVSCMVLPAPLVGRYRERLGFYSCTVPALEQYTLAAFLEEGHFESHLNRMRVFYRRRRDQIIGRILDSPLAGRCRVLREEAGLHFLLELETGRSDGELRCLAAERGIRLSFLSDYQSQAERGRPHTLVVNYPGLGLEGMEQAWKELAELL